MAMGHVLRSAIQSRPLSCFFLLAFLLSWYTWYLRLFGVHTSGGMNPLGVLLAALIMSGICGGWPGIKSWLARLVRVGVAPGWYAVAVLLPVGVAVAALLLNLLCGARLAAPAQAPSWQVLAAGFAIQFMFVALGEEPGWRGFALVELQKRLSPIAATLLLAAVWALWHLPLMGTAVAWNEVPAFVIGVFSGCFALTWIFNSTGGSVFLCMILHACVNTIGPGVIFPLFSGADAVRLWWIYTLLWIAVVAIILWRAGTALRGWR